jgi:hypothetical protein
MRKEDATLDGNAAGAQSFVIAQVLKRKRAEIFPRIDGEILSAVLQ